MVTAASSGIGLDVAKELIVKGYRMVSNFRNITISARSKEFYGEKVKV
jgi:NADP-dependent 3-hydroxy acid dehydrogenase YdfG